MVTNINANKELNNFGDVKIIDESLPKVDDELERKIITLVQTAWTKHFDDRRNCGGINLEEKIQTVLKADRLEHQPVIKNKPKYRSKIYLPWVRKVHLSVTAYMAILLLSGTWFSISGQTSEDKTNAERMTKVFNYLFENNYNFRKVIIQGLNQQVIKGMTCIKGFWQVIQSYLYDYTVVTDNSGKESVKRVKNPVKKYNDVKLEYIDIEDFAMYPTTGCFSDAMKIHRTKKKFSEIKSNSQNYLPGALDKLEKKYNDNGKNDVEQESITLKEVWFSQNFIGDVELSNCVALIAEDEVLLELKNNPYDYGISPFLYTVYNDIPGSLLGRGVCFDATDLQDFANVFINIISDCVRIGAYPILQAPASANPDDYISKPGAWWAIKDELYKEGVRIEPFRMELGNLPITFDTLGQIKQEFDIITIPEFIKGARPETDETATRDSLVQQNAQTNLSNPAENFNEEILKPLLQLMYTLYRQRAQIDEEVRLMIARLCLESTKEIELPVMDSNNNPVEDPNNLGQPLIEEQEVEKTPQELLDELGILVPLSKINISIIGYKNNAEAQQTLNNLQLYMGALRDFGDEQDQRKVNRDSMQKTIIRCLKLDNKDILMTDEEALMNEIKKFKEQVLLESEKQNMIQELQAEGILLPPVLAPVQGQPVVSQ